MFTIFIKAFIISILVFLFCLLYMRFYDTKEQKKIHTFITNGIVLIQIVSFVCMLVFGIISIILF